MSSYKDELVEWLLYCKNILFFIQAYFIVYFLVYRYWIHVVYMYIVELYM